MTRRTARNVCHRTQLIFLDKILSQKKLVRVLVTINCYWLAAGRLFVSHIEHLLPRSQIFFRSAVAIQAPLHLQRGIVIHERHSIDWPVAGVAAHAFIDVNAVIEVNKVGQIIYTAPYQGSSTAEALSYRLQHGCARPDLRVAIHASLGWRNTGKT